MNNPNWWVMVMLVLVAVGGYLLGSLHGKDSN